MGDGAGGDGGCSIICGLIESFSGVDKKFLFDRIAELEASESITTCLPASAANGGVFHTDSNIFRFLRQGTAQRSD
jgi:hypothetical protein